MSSVLLTKLNEETLAGLQLVVTAFDGFLYVIDGLTGTSLLLFCLTFA